MKAARFEFISPTTVDEAVRLIGEDGAKAASGFQSLGPMLNLRLAQPRLVVGLTRIPELRAIDEDADRVVYGAAITHAEIEDGRVPDPTGGILPAVARGIAYRAVRNRGTIGGSLAHADPAADWATVLAALGGRVRIAGPRGVRAVEAADLPRGAFSPALDDDELIAAVDVPRPGPAARWAYRKVSRKIGEFSEAMSAAYSDPDNGILRVVVGATDSRPIVVPDAAALLDGGRTAQETIDALALGDDPVLTRLRATVLQRTVDGLEPISEQTA